MNVINRRLSIDVGMNLVALHRWKDAPDIVKFLRDFHRHLFNIRVWVEVGHANRDTEFFILKRDLNYAVESFCSTHSVKIPGVTPDGAWYCFEQSCEALADWVGTYLISNFKYKVLRVTVSEDGENAGSVYYTYDDIGRI